MHCFHDLGQKVMAMRCCNCTFNPANGTARTPFESQPATKTSHRVGGSAPPRRRSMQHWAAGLRDRVRQGVPVGISGRRRVEMAFICLFEASGKFFQ